MKISISYGIHWEAFNVEVTEIEKRFLRRITGVYTHLQALYEPAPEEASEYKMRQYRRWLNKRYKKMLQSLPEDVRVHMADSVGDREFFTFMKACKEQLAVVIDGEKQRFYLTASGLPYDARAALWKLAQGTNWPSVLRHGNDLEIAVDGTEAYRRRLFLKDVEGIPEGAEEEWFAAIEMVLTKEGDRYCLSGEVFDAMADDYRAYSLTFADAEVITEVYDAINSINLWDHPWNFLITAASGIVAKAYLPGAHCNDQELQMLPLLTELAALDDWDELPDDFPFTFPTLKALAAKHGCNTLVPLFDALGQQVPDSAEYTNQVQKIISALCDQSVEPLWREIFDEIYASQADYPDKAEECCPAPVLISTREAVQAQMRQLGFEGDYPNFVKEGPLQGVHLEDSYDTAYVLGPKARMVSRIRCIETVIDRELTVQFLCGTALLKDGEEAGDIYSCLFNAGGRRLFHHTEYSTLLYEPTFEYIPQDLILCVSVAAKKAQLQRLTKDEQHTYSGMREASLRTFLTFLVVMGGMFGLAMTAVFMLFTMLVSFLIGGSDAMHSVLAVVPWGWVLLFCWLGYGGTMAIITTIAKRN